MHTPGNYYGKGAFTAGLDFSIEEMRKYDASQGIIRIREEISGFLLNLHLSNMAGSAVKRIHFLFSALTHLDNMEKEIRISAENEEILKLEMVHEKIRSLRSMIGGYIRQLSGE